MYIYKQCIHFVLIYQVGLPSVGENFLKTIEKFAVTVGDVTSVTNKNKTIPNENISQCTLCYFTSYYQKVAQYVKSYLFG